MKTLIRYSVITAIAAPLLLTACADNDVYDPDKVRPVPPVENPLGDDFVAPDGFDWSMISTVKLNIEVKDELNGQYNYLAEVFTTNPLIDNTAAPIAAGYAKEGNNFVVEISIPKLTERIYIRQTDPKQRKELFEFAAPQDGGTLNCKLYYTGGTTTRAGTGSTSASEAAKVAGVTELADKNYTEAAPEIPVAPSQSDEPVSPYDRNKFNNGAKIVIQVGEESSTTYRMASGKGTIFVKGTWKVNNITDQFDIYVLNGGKVEFTAARTFASIQKFIVEKGGTVEAKATFSTKAGEWYFGGNFTGSGDVTFEREVTSVTIASGTALSVSGTLKPNSQVTKNFGTITAANLTATQGTPEIYNAGIIDVANELYVNNTSFTNINEVKAGTLLRMNNNSNILNKGKVSAHDINLTSSTFANYGEVLVDEQSGNFATNNSTKATVVNHYEGVIKGYHLNGGVSFYNDGFAEFTLFENSARDMLYNSCTLIVKDKFNWGNVTLDNGSITGGKPDNMSATEGNASLWKPVPVVTSNDSPIVYTLKNGSMIKTSLFHINNGPNVIRGEGTNPSLLQLAAVHISNRSNTNLSDLVLEIPENAFTYSNGATGINNGKWITSGCSTTGWEESKYTFSTCGDYFNPGNPGEPNPGNPEKPDIEDNTAYTYAFEDQWPAYGDFDMNDVVVTIDKIAATDENKKLTIKGRVRAVGANRKTGVGIQILNVSSNGVALTGKVQSGTPVFESGQSNPVVILCTNAHKYCNPAIADDDFTFYSTNPSGDNSYHGDGAEFELIMTFSSAEEAMKAMNVKNLDVFIISKEPQGNVKRTEVHMANYAPTSLGTTALFGMANDASAHNSMLNMPRKGYYMSTEGLAWGICIPGTEVWKWPKEFMIITNVYPGFKNWVINGGKAEDLGWISNHNNDIYIKP